jgi:hypothetical protein
LAAGRQRPGGAGYRIASQSRQVEGVMATTIKQIESPPDDFPDLPRGLSDAAARLDSSVLWARIEAYVAHRWTERDVSWIVQGPGEWVAPLTPVTIASVQQWTSANGWEAVTLSPAPLGGFFLPATGPYLFAGIAGDDDVDVPAIVFDAYRRLAEYLAQPAPIGARAGVSNSTFTIGNGVTSSWRRDLSWMAKALQDSGAADLLRGFRRVPS